MTDRPLIFSPAMVRALLDGSKTQDRRVIKPMPSQVKAWGDDFAICPSATIVNDPDGGFRWVQFDHPLGGPYTAIPMRPDIGDRLWVRETWRTWKDYDHLPPRELPDDAPILYEATIFEDLDPANSDRFGKVRKSIFMQSRFSRLTLLVIDVRVQRLQDISEADAIAEGVERVDYEGDNPAYAGSYGWKSYETYADGLAHPHAAVPNKSPVVSYKELWNAINGPGSWESNPWVTATTFGVVQTNIGEL